MDDFQRHEAARLFRDCAKEHNCKNEDFLDAVRELIGRDGPALPTKSPDDTTLDKRSMLPTKRDLRKAVEENLGAFLLDCRCDLCRNKDDRDNSEFKHHFQHSKLTDQRIQDLAILLFCGCMFAAANQKLRNSQSLMHFINDYGNHGDVSSREVHQQLFCHIARVPSECSQAHDAARRWKKVKRMEDICVACRWDAFKDAHDLKKTVFDVHELEEDWDKRESEGLDDMEKKNMPFIHNSRLPIKTEQSNPAFFSCRIHPRFCESKTIKDMKLFRKVYTYHPELDREAFANATEEAKIARKMSKRSTHAAKLVYAFHDKDPDHKFVELLYKQYDSNLAEIFSSGRGRQTPASPTVELVDNWLWQAILKVVEVVVGMHEAIEAGELGCPGHIDIHPGNILVDWNGSDDTSRATLHLTDFGQASKNMHPDEFHGGHPDYAPPETEEPPTTAYDVWSMACVLLKVLIFIEYGVDGLNKFHNDCGHEDGSTHSFWVKVKGHETHSLRKAVETRIKGLAAATRPRTKKIALKINEMLTSRTRPSMSECLKFFRTEGRIRNTLKQELVMCGAERWSVSYRNVNQERIVPTKIAIYRSTEEELRRVQRGLSGAKKTVAIDIHWDRPDARLSHTWDSLSEWFTPEAFFDNVPGTSQRPLACRFKTIHKDDTFLFDDSNEYLDFVSVMTCQDIKPRSQQRTGSNADNSWTVAGSSLSSSEVKWTRKRMKAKTETFTGGILQIWELLADDQYEKRFNPSPSASTPGRRGPKIFYRHPKDTHWKMVIWATQRDSGKRSCVIIDIGQNSWDVVGREEKGNRLEIKKNGKADFIRGTVLLAAEDPGSSSTRCYPELPMEPSELYKVLTHKFSCIDINFSTRNDKNDILGIMKTAEMI